MTTNTLNASVALRASVDFGHGPIAFPPIYRRREVLSYEALAQYGFTISDDGDVQTSYQFVGADPFPLVTSQFTKWHSIERLDALSPEDDRGRWLVVRRHLSLACATAYASSIIDAMIHEHDVYEVEAHIDQDGFAFTLVTVIAPAEGPDNLAIYKCDITDGDSCRTLTATFGPDSSSLDEDLSANILA